MKWLVGGRASGRTTEMLRWVAESSDGDVRVLISLTSDEAMMNLRRAREMGLEVESWQFIGWEEVRDGRFRGSRIGYPDVRFGIDNLDLLLSRLLPIPVSAASIEAGLLEIAHSDVRQPWLVWMNSEVLPK